MTSYEFEQRQTTPSIVASTYSTSNASESISCANADKLGFCIDLDTLPSFTELTLKAQAYDTVNSAWVDHYRNNDGSMELDEIAFAVSASTTGQTFHFTFNTEGFGLMMRWLYKSNAGTGAVQSLTASVTKETE